MDASACRMLLRLYWNYIMINRKLKVGDKVKIINASAIEPCELNKVGIIVEVRYDDYYRSTCVVDMGRPRREREPENTCWYLPEKYIELMSKPNQQLLFEFMNEAT